MVGATIYSKTIIGKNLIFNSECTRTPRESLGASHLLYELLYLAAGDRDIPSDSLAAISGVLQREVRGQGIGRNVNGWKRMEDRQGEQDMTIV